MRSMLSSVVDTNNATKKLLEEYIENRASFESAKRRDNEYRILSGNNSKMNSVRKREILLKDDETNYSRRSSINYTTHLNDSEIYRNYSTDEVFGNWSSVGISKSEEDLGSTSRGNSVEGNTINWNIDIYYHTVFIDSLHTVFVSRNMYIYYLFYVETFS